MTRAVMRTARPLEWLTGDDISQTALSTDAASGYYFEPARGYYRIRVHITAHGHTKQPTQGVTTIARRQNFARLVNMNSTYLLVATCNTTGYARKGKESTTMAILHVRNMPDDLYRQLQQRAETERRSLSAEVVILLQQAMTRPRAYDPATYADLFHQIVREREVSAAAHGPFPDSVTDIRADRERDG
jgi:plasmid stability protein